MSRGTHDDRDLVVLDRLIEGIIVDAYGDDEQLWAFRQAFEDDVTLPADGFVIGEPVSVVKIDYDGNERRGLLVPGEHELDGRIVQRHHHVGVFFARQAVDSPDALRFEALDKQV